MIIPTALATYPRTAARALDEIGFEFLDRLDKRIIMGFLPGCGTGALTEVSCPS
ncbi:MAG: hypothetical protein ACPL3P_02995 [Anaerolineales bacterium]